MAADPELRSHQEWLGYLQPVGLVVSPPALVAAQAFVNRNVAREQQRLAAVVARARVASPDGGSAETWALTDFPAFAREVLDWQPADLVNAPGQPALPDSLVVALPEYGDSLKPTYAVPDPDDGAKHLLLVELVPIGTDLDREPPAEGRRWQASAQMRFERLLRETGVPVGILCNGTHLRLVYRPVGESSGHLTFPVAAMMETSGRPILGALVMLLGAERLFTLPPDQRLPHILRESRKYQNDVSTALAEQVLGALHELLRGLQAADDAARGALLRDVRREAPAEVYGGLLTVLLRLVFVLYAEDRGLVSGDPVYQSSYALTGLYASLREDAARHPDTMDQRFGAWARVLVLFRLIHDGASHGGLHLPPRYGRLFDPDVYPFLEGRPHRALRQAGERVEVPRVPDGVVLRVLDALLMLDGERLSYRALDVEQIGSVYEAMMGFALETAAGPSIAVKPQHVVVDLAALLAKGGAERVKLLAEEAGCKLPAAQAEKVKAAKTVEALVAALDKRVSPRTPRVVPAGGMFLQPGEERRRSGSHYTPRSLTEPIVRTTLRPVLDALRGGGDLTPPAPLSLSGEGGERAASAEVRSGSAEAGPRSTEAGAASAEVRQGSAEVPPRSAEVRQGSAEVRQGSAEVRQGSAEVRQGSAEVRQEGAEVPPTSAEVPPTSAEVPPTSAEVPPTSAEASFSPSPFRERGVGGEVPRPEAILALKVCDPAMGSGAFLVEACRALGDVLVASWQRYGLPDDLPEGEDPVLHARRLVAQRCLYGVDKNPFAVDLARLSLWLVTLAKDHPFTFLDHALRQGDSLVGLSREQIACVHWEVGKQVPLVRAAVERAVREAEAKRREIHARAMGDDVRAKRRLLDEAEGALRDARMLGDAVVAAFFDEEKDGARKKRVKEVGELALELAAEWGRASPDLTPPAPLSLAGEGGGRRVGASPDLTPPAPLSLAGEGGGRRVGASPDLTPPAPLSLSGEGGGRRVSAPRGEPPPNEQASLSPPSPARERGAGGVRSVLEGMARGLRERARAVTPFHWELEFPEVFSRENAGFDAVVGNPPFLGGTRISGAFGVEYLAFLTTNNSHGGGQADLVAYFFARAFDMLRMSATMGMVATNSIAQGDTRSAGLARIVSQGGQIYHARKRVRWTSDAAVIVSTICIARSKVVEGATLDGKHVEAISAYLFHIGGSAAPAQLDKNAGFAFKGVEPYGDGFMFDDSNPLANSLAELQSAIQSSPANAACIRPFLGGEEFANSPRQQYRRHAIYFADWTLERASAWPDLVDILRRKVMPQRSTKARDVAAWPWWQFWRSRPELAAAASLLDELLVAPDTSKHLSFGFIPSSVLPAKSMIAVVSRDRAVLSALQSRIHHEWCLFFGSTMKDDLRYTIADCFETFPFPAGVLEAARGDASAQALPAVQRLEDVGQRYYEFRAQLMVAHDEGLTATYNRFHDPDERDAGIVRLRELHAEMDRAVLDAYGWQDVATRCEFLLDYEEEEGDEEEGGKRRKKKPWRYRWPDAVRDEVLARLIALNGERAAEERRAGEALAKAEGAGAKPKRAARKKKGDDEGQGGLFG